MTLSLRPDVATTDTDHGSVLLDERSGRYFQLNTTGTHVLHALLAGDDPEQIATGLAEHHHLPAARARADVDAIIEQLRTANLVVTR
ncbi:lasso peptide biosynthesis PqqD family chaperone [Amycolatopsis sp. QT-25]|uniref:lasso peptide biosynthesis PqqD family chaperone n=1 Tax=Amycolatopsis sp. QT-25 TaxID=3034022 RepID=UPI0023EC70D4|nr:lasso peptide biosynthesis PqqD family chaperone [Amycolatopsis sp. QT-25]WET76768.1 lasso peptide biosynthesis PqqD family chaperone [Amycolatopsis sp. QT-25]